MRCWSHRPLLPAAPPRKPRRRPPPLRDRPPAATSTGAGITASDPRLTAVDVELGAEIRGVCSRLLLERIFAVLLAEDEFSGPQRSVERTGARARPLCFPVLVLWRIVSGTFSTA